MLPASKRRKVAEPLTDQPPKRGHDAPDAPLFADLIDFVLNHPPSHENIAVNVQTNGIIVKNLLDRRIENEIILSPPLRLSQKKSLLDHCRALSNPLISESDLSSTIKEIENLDLDQKLLFKSSSFCQWLSKQNCHPPSLIAAVHLSLKQLLDLNAYLCHLFTLEDETTLIDEVRSLSVSPSKHVFSHVIFSILRGGFHNSSANELDHKVRANTLNAILRQLCPKNLRDDLDVSCYALVLSYISEMKPLNVAEQAAVSIFQTFLSSLDSIEPSQQLEILEKFLKEPVGASLLDSILNEWCLVLSTEAISQYIQDRVLKYKDVDWMYAIPLWQRCIETDLDNSVQSISSTLNQIINIYPEDVPMMKIVLMIAAVLLHTVTKKGQSFSKYDEWLLKVLTDSTLQAARTTLFTALTELTSLQTPDVINSNIKVLLSPQLKLKTESKEYTQFARRTLGDLAKLPSEMARQPKEKLEDLVQFWRQTFEKTGKLPGDIRQKKFLHPLFFSNKVVPFILDSQSAIEKNDHLSVLNFAKAMCDDKLITKAQYSSFIDECQAARRPQEPAQAAVPPPTTIPDLQATADHDFAPIGSAIIQFFGSAKKTYSSLQETAQQIRSAAQQCAASEQSRIKLAKFILDHIRASKSTSENSDQSFVQSGGGASPRHSASQSTSTRLSIRLFKLFADSVWKEPLLLAAMREAFSLSLLAALAAPDTVFDSYHYSSMFICLSSQLTVEKEESGPDWASNLISQFPLQDPIALKHVITFGCSVIRLCETAFDVVALYPRGVATGNFTTNPAPPKGGLFKENMGYVPRNLATLLHLVYKRLKFESTASSSDSTSKEYDFAGLRHLFDGGFMHTLAVRAGPLSLTDFLQLAPQILPNSPFSTLFIRQQVEIYSLQLKRATLLSCIADHCLHAASKGKECNANIISLLVDLYSTTIREDCEDKIWLLDWIEARLGAGEEPSSEHVLGIVARLPSSMLLRPESTIPFHSSASLNRVETFLQRCFLQHSKEFLTRIPIRNWMYAFLTLVGKDQTDAAKSSIRSAKLFLRSLNPLSIMFTVYWPELEGDVVTGMSDEMIDLFDYQRIISGAALSIFESKNPSADQASFFDVLNSAPSAPCPLAYALIEAIIDILAEKPSQRATDPNTSLIRVDVSLPQRSTSPGVIFSRLTSLVSYLWRNLSKVPPEASEKSRSFVVILLESIVMCCSYGSNLLPLDASDHVGVFSQLLWTLIIAEPTMLLEVRNTSALIDQNRSLFFGDPKVPFLNVLLQIDDSRLEMIKFKISMMSSDRKEALQRALTLHKEDIPGSKPLDDRSTFILQDLLSKCSLPS